MNTYGYPTQPNSAQLNSDLIAKTWQEYLKSNRSIAPSWWQHLVKVGQNAYVLPCKGEEEGTYKLFLLAFRFICCGSNKESRSFNEIDGPVQNAILRQRFEEFVVFDPLLTEPMCDVFGVYDSEPIIALNNRPTNLPGHTVIKAGGPSRALIPLVYVDHYAKSTSDLVFPAKLCGTNLSYPLTGDTKPLVLNSFIIDENLRSLIA